MISVSSLKKSFVTRGSLQPLKVLLGLPRTAQDQTVLENVALDVRRGEFLGVLGRNGSGKSTLLRIVGGVISPNQGSITRVGSLTGLYELGFAGNKTLTGRAYAERYLALIGVHSSEIPNHLREIEEFAELGEYFEFPVRTYSSGMAARLFFSVITSRKTDILLIDEALSVGDQYFQNKCWARIRSRISEGAAGILVTHDWAAVVRLCRRAVILERGTVKASGNADEIVREYLALPPPCPGSLRFAQVPRSCNGVSGQEFAFNFSLESPHRNGKVAYSIESIDSTFGWNVLLSHDGLPLPKEQTECRLVLPSFPLSRGKYLLNLFLLDADQLSDVRGWLYGNGIELNVEGSEAGGLVRLKWETVRSV